MIYFLERIKQNANLFDFNLTDAEMKEIEGLDQVTLLS